MFSNNFQFREHPLTRRRMLSTVASIYDPLGFVAPFVLLGKRILQQLCQDKVGWDQSLPDELGRQWERWLQDIRNLPRVRIKQRYIPTHFTDIKKHELYHFSDTSVTGYGECSYIRAINTKGDVHCSFLMGKARVAPTKVTVPNLELSAAVVATRTIIVLRN